MTHPVRLGVRQSSTQTTNTKSTLVNFLFPLGRLWKGRLHQFTTLRRLFWWMGYTTNRNSPTWFPSIIFLAPTSSPSIYLQPTPTQRPTHAFSGWKATLAVFSINLLELGGQIRIKVKWRPNGAGTVIISTYISEVAFHKIFLDKYKRVCVFKQDHWILQEGFAKNEEQHE